MCILFIIQGFPVFEIFFSILYTSPFLSLPYPKSVMCEFKKSDLGF